MSQREPDSIRILELSCNTPRARKRPFVIAFFVLLFLVAISPGQRSAFAQSFNYPNFTSTAGLQLNGNTDTTLFGQLRLTDNSTGTGANETSSVYYNTLVNVFGGFTTTFQFRVSDVHAPGPPNAGGEGLTFIIQKSPSGLTALGTGGGDLGYGGIPNSVVIELDVALTPGYDAIGNHISFHTLDQNPNSANELTASKADYQPPVGFNNGGLHTIRIVYDGAQGWDIYYDDLVTPVLGFNYALGKAINSSTAYVGFTSSTGTGNDVETHIIENWSFSSNNPTAADATITGSVTDANGAPIAGAVVNLSGTQNRKFITDANGNYYFNDVEAGGFYTVTPSSPNYSFSPGERSFSQIGDTTSAVFTGEPRASSVNAIDTAEYFVRQHYLDFLNREPDEAGFNFWSDQILACGSDQACIEARTINVSAAYFLSIEFNMAGGLVDGLYRASFGRAPLYAEFMADSQTVGRNVRVGSDDWMSQSATNRRAFIADWVQRAEFRAAYDGLTNEAYVDTLISHTGVSFAATERNALVNALNNSSRTRSDVLTQIVDNEGFISAKRNEMFVMMEYFGYLRRDPDAAGYQFWLNKLNQFGGNFEAAEMVKAFITSPEYRHRFDQ